MKKKLITGLFAVIILLIYFLIPLSDTAIIKKNIKTIANQLHFIEAEHPIVTAGKIKTITKYLANNITASIYFQGEKQTKDFSKLEIKQHLLAYATRVAPLQVNIKDLKVTFIKPDYAKADFTAYTNRERGGENLHDAQAISSFWQQDNSDWLLTKIENVEIVN